MAGSLNHTVNDEGAFTMETIENLGDAHEALEQCFDIIAYLLEGRQNARLALELACRRAHAPIPKAIPKFGTRGGC